MPKSSWTKSSKRKKPAAGKRPRAAVPEEAFLREALELAGRGAGWTSPNPMVGALVAKDGKIVGRGWHKEFGGPHAEIFALEEAGAAAKGAALYCTLEPCNHSGKTPPCVQAILRAGIAEVIVGARDPNPVAAGGMEALRAAGLKVRAGILEQECKQLNAPFFKRLRTGLPLVSLKWAMSADGKIATAAKDSKWITGPDARAEGHVLRARHDAVLIGLNTLRADDSKLTCRLKPEELQAAGIYKLKQPRRVILDSFARTPLEGALWHEAGGEVIIFCGAGASRARQEALRAKGAAVVALSAPDGAAPAGEPGRARLLLREILAALAARGIQSVLVEGGGEVLGSFIDERLADRAYIFIAPKILGGEGCVTIGSGRGVERVAMAAELRNPQARRVGPDILLAGQLGAWEWLE